VEVVEVDVRRQAHGDPIHDVTDQRRVLEDDLFLEGGRDLRVLLLRIAEQGLHVDLLHGAGVPAARR